MTTEHESAPEAAVETAAEAADPVIETEASATVPTDTPEASPAEATETPTEAEASAEDTPAAEAPAIEAPAEEAPATETPAPETQATEAPAAESPAEEALTPDGEPTYGRPAIVAARVDELPDEVIDDFEKALEHTVPEFREGDIVEGTVVSVDQDGVMVDIGYKSEGIIPLKELSIRKNVDPHEVVQVGDRIEALVLDKEDEEGRLVLSKKRAQYERTWGKIEKIFQEEGVVEGTVIEVVKGGLIVDIGLRGFLPASLIDLRRVRDLQPFIGEKIKAKVIELDRNRNNVVLSRRKYLEEEQAEQRQGFLDELQEGEIREGVVSSVVNFGAFVDLGGMDGLVHVSELSWQHVNHPGEVVKVGDKVKVKVLEVDRERERISLSIKQTQEDPWTQFSNAHEVGDIVEGTVTKTVPFGAFVSVGEGVEGLVHVSEIAPHRVESPELELSIGQKVKVKITEMDENRRRVSLSIKQALPDWKEREQASRESQPRRRPPRTREFEREEEAKPAEPAVDVDASLEAILQELKERGIGRR